MGKLKGLGTPRVPDASRSQNPIFKEVHAEGKIGRADEEELLKTREFILDKYQIPRDNCILMPSIEKGRKIRAFTILENRADPFLICYGEGHTSHALLLNMIMEKFGDQLGIHNREEIDDDFDKDWITRKGFLDPYQNGFNNFPRARGGLITVLKENADINGYTPEESAEIVEGKVPNWFLSGDSSKDLI